MSASQSTHYSHFAPPAHITHEGSRRQSNEHGCLAFWPLNADTILSVHCSCQLGSDPQPPNTAATTATVDHCVTGRYTQFTQHPSGAGTATAPSASTTTTAGARICSYHSGEEEAPAGYGLLAS